MLNMYGPWLFMICMVYMEFMAWTDMGGYGWYAWMICFVSVACMDRRVFMLACQHACGQAGL